MNDGTVKPSQKIPEGDTKGLSMNDGGVLDAQTHARVEVSEIITGRDIKESEITDPHEKALWRLRWAGYRYGTEVLAIIEECGDEMVDIAELGDLELRSGYPRVSNLNISGRISVRDLLLIYHPQLKYQDAELEGLYQTDIDEFWRVIASTADMRRTEGKQPRDMWGRAPEPDLKSLHWFTKPDGTRVPIVGVGDWNRTGCGIHENFPTGEAEIMGTTRLSGYRGTIPDSKLAKRIRIINGHRIEKYIMEGRGVGEFSKYYIDGIEFEIPEKVTDIVPHKNGLLIYSQFEARGGGFGKEVFYYSPETVRPTSRDEARADQAFDIVMHVSISSPSKLSAAKGFYLQLNEQGEFDESIKRSEYLFVREFHAISVDNAGKICGVALLNNGMLVQFEGEKITKILDKGVEKNSGLKLLGTASAGNMVFTYKQIGTQDHMGTNLAAYDRSTGKIHYSILGLGNNQLPSKPGSVKMEAKETDFGYTLIIRIEYGATYVYSYDRNLKRISNFCYPISTLDSLGIDSKTYVGDKSLYVPSSLAGLAQVDEINGQKISQIVRIDRNQLYAFEEDGIVYMLASFEGRKGWYLTSYDTKTGKGKISEDSITLTYGGLSSAGDMIKCGEGIYDRETFKPVNIDLSNRIVIDPKLIKPKPKTELVTA